MRRRGERIERSFAHLYDTGGMRRTHLRGHVNILKRVLIHAGGFNLRLAAVIATLLVLVSNARLGVVAICSLHRFIAVMSGLITSSTSLVVNPSAAATCTTGS